MECAKEHLQALYEYKGERGIRQARKHMTWYAKGFMGAADLRGKLSVIETLEQGVEVIDNAIAHLLSGDYTTYNGHEDELVNPQMMV